MTSGFGTVVFPVRNLEQAKAQFSSLLGAAPVMDEPYYVQFNVAGQEIGLDPHGHGKGMTGPVNYWQVDDIGTSLKGLVDAGATVQQAISDVGGGKLIATVQDADGNVIGLMHLPPIVQL